MSGIVKRLPNEFSTPHWLVENGGGRFLCPPQADGAKRPNNPFFSIMAHSATNSLYNDRKEELRLV